MRGRFKGKGVVVGLFTLIGLAVGGLFSAWFLLRDPYGPVYNLTAAGDDRVALLRQGFEERGHVHVGVWNRQGPVWSTALFGIEDDAGLVVADDMLLVRATEARGHAQLHAFALSSGELRWRGPESVPPDDPWRGPSMVATDEHVFEAHGAAMPVLTILDKESGEKVGHVDFEGGEGAQDLLVQAGAVLIDTGQATWNQVGAGGEVVAADPPATWHLANGQLVSPEGELSDAQNGDRILRGGGLSVLVRGDEVRVLGSSHKIVAAGLRAAGVAGSQVAIATESGVALLGAELDPHSAIAIENEVRFGP